MRRRFLAIRLLSGIFKLLAILNLIAMIGVIVYVLVTVEGFETIEAKLPVMGAAAAIAIVGGVLLWAIGQMLDLFMAIEINTRASNKMLQRMGRLMDERL